jgi:SAM-dependent methyltransferase
MYNYDFHKSIEHEELPQAQSLANYIHRHVKPSVFLDFGCSSGLYLREIKRVMPTIEAKGFEFSEDAVRYALCSDVNQCDLTHPLNLAKKDNTLGLCLEVLEHIRDEDWLPVLTNLTKLCDRLIFSAAVPGQGGTGHINCRNKIDWIRRFHSLGWVVDADATVHILNFIRQGQYMGWFANNAMVLVKA